MMTRVAPQCLVFSWPLALLLLAGCPSAPQLQVNPRAIALGSTGTGTAISISNTGGGTLTWTADEVVRANTDAPWTAQDIPWLSITSSTTGRSTSAINHLLIEANRENQPVGLYGNTGIRITSNAETIVVPVSMEVAATLFASPSEIALTNTATSASFTVTNSGSAAAAWEVLYLEDPSDLSSAADLPDDFLVSPNPGSTAAGDSTTVDVTWGAGRSDFYLLLQSDAGSTVLSFVFGAALEGLVVTPETLTVYVDPSTDSDGAAVTQAASTLTIGNTSAVSKTWSITVNNVANPSVTAPLSLSPSTGSTAAGDETAVSVTVSDPATVLTGSGNYTLTVTSGDSFLLVPIVVEQLQLPVIAVSDPPETSSSHPEIQAITTLDFGTTEVQKTFYIANIGSLGSKLYFKISNADDELTAPVVISVKPAEGGANGEDGSSDDFYHPTDVNRLIDGRAITVTIDRSNMTEDVEYHDLTIEATDSTFENVISAVDSATLSVRVERPPLTIEGAINRSRPPYVMRFTFLLRDTVGAVIPTLTAADRAHVAFTVTDGTTVLDPNETSLFVTGPENLRANIALLLDYTGSMYYAGTQDTSNPLEPGEALANVKSAAKRFIDDLPSGFRVALMYYNDRQQLTRLMHPFSTDKASLKAMLDQFTLPVAQYGVSDIRDALTDAIARIAAEDSEDTLPFDEADLRAVVFVTDGLDNASVATATDVTTAATDARVRLYPLAYSPDANADTTDLIVMAKDTGGHLYNAGDVSNLSSLLASQKALSLSASTLSGQNMAYFNIENTSDTNLTWTVTPDASAAWIAEVLPNSGTTAPGTSTTVAVRVAPSTVAANSTVIAALAITSNNGDGTATLRMDVGADNTTAQTLTLSLADEPGQIWNELRNQIVLTYITPQQAGGTYNILATYTPDSGTAISGSFEEDAVFYPGDVLAGQVSLTTSGITTDPTDADPVTATRAEIYVRADYVPRNVTRFKMRFFLGAPSDIPQAAVNALASDAALDVELASEGLLASTDASLPSWRLLSEGDGVYDLLTNQDNPLAYGAFGNLLKITVTGLNNFMTAFNGLARQPEFLLEMRVDNEIYVVPATATHPSETKYFLYPGGPTYPARSLSVSETSDTASSASSAAVLAAPGINPEAAGVWDRDGDGIADFMDPYPDDAGLPGQVAVPNPLEIASGDTEGTLTIRNNRLDTFTWSLAPASIPAWVANISYGAANSPTPQSTLAPGESETVHMTVDRTGLAAGYYPVTLTLNTNKFGDEEVLATLIVVSK